MVKGKSTCKTLKAIRRQIAEANDIKYEPRECHYEGPCLGTCPACEAEVRYLERQLGLRRQLGRAVSVIGVSVGLLSACTSAGTKAVTEKPEALRGDVDYHESEARCDSEHVMVVGKVAVPEEPDTASFVKEQQSRKPSPAPKAPLVAQEEDEQVLGGVADPRIMAELQMMAPDTTKVFGDIAEQMPMFPGGDRKLMEYLASSIQYPPECEESCVQGRVIVTFVVERDGSISQAKVAKSLDPLLDAEALRVVNAMPKWIPGRQNGVTVAVKYTIPVTFRLK
jgi:TonB family protein